MSPAHMSNQLISMCLSPTAHLLEEPLAGAQPQKDRGLDLLRHLQEGEAIRQIVPRKDALLARQLLCSRFRCVGYVSLHKWE